MKLKWIYLTFACMLILVLFGCEMEAEDGKANRHYIQIEEIELVDVSLEREEGSEVAVYQAKIKNRSKHTVQGVTIEVELKDGQHTTIVTQDTLKPGDTSGWIRCVGPQSLKLKDLKKTRFTIKMIDEENQETVVTYDVGRDFYTYSESTERETINPKVKVDDIEFVDPTFAPEGAGVKLQTYLKNNSSHAIQNIMYTFEDDLGETHTLYHPLEIGGNQQSSILTTSNLSKKKWKDYQFKRVSYTYQDKGQWVCVVYDVRLDQYFKEE